MNGGDSVEWRLIVTLCRVGWRIEDESSIWKFVVFLKG